MAEADPDAARPVGLTQDVGWQIGVSRTVDASIDQVWALLTSAAGEAIWITDGVELPLERGRGAPITAPDGSTGELRSVRVRERIRLRWQPAGEDHATTVQVAVRAVAEGRTLVRFHQEHLRDAGERERQRAHWRVVLTRLADALG